jgi:hypothetical protein
MRPSDDISAARLAELRAALHPEPDSRLAESILHAQLSLHPDLAAEWERERSYVANYGKRKARDGRASGWRKGQPQCPACRRILSQRNGWCPNCRTFAGRHDHGR